MERNSNILKCEVQENAPTILIKGSKSVGQDYFQILDNNDNVLFSVDRNGDLPGKHHLTDLKTDIPDREGNAALFEGQSVYIGPVRISYQNNKLVQEQLNRIPAVLAAASYNITSADFAPRSYSDLSARQWLVLARNKVNDISIKARDVFTDAGDWTTHGLEHTVSLTSSAQTQLDAIKMDVVDLETLTTSMDTDLTTAENNIVLKANKSNPVLSGQLALGKSSAEGGIAVDIESSSDVHIQMTRTGFHRGLITRHSDGYTGFSVSNGPNAGSKLKLHDAGRVQAFGAVDIPTGSHYKINGTRLAVTDMSDSSSYYTKTEADSAIQAVVGAAPAALDTLVEIGQSLDNDADFAGTMVTQLGLKRNVSDSYTKTEIDAVNSTQNGVIATNTSKVTYDAQAAVSANTAKRTYPASEENKVTANTAKVTYDAQVAVSANTAKRTYPASEENKVTANTAKVTYDAQAAVSANTAKRTYPQSEEDKVTANTNKISYTDASLVSGHVTLHTQHTNAIGTKASLSDHQTYTGRQQFGSGAASVDGRLTIHSNDGGANSLLIMDSRKQADSCTIYMRHAGGNKFSIGLNADSDLELYNRATNAPQITLPIGGGITLADGAVATTQSQSDNSTKLCTTSYCDTAVAAGGGSSGITVLNQRGDSTATSTYIGQSSSSYRQLLVSDTEVIVYFEVNTPGHGWLRLPLLSSVDAGDKYVIRNLLKDYGCYVGPHETDSDNGETIRLAWSWSHVSSNNVFVSKNYRILECIVLQTISGSKRWVAFKHNTSYSTTN